MNDAEIAPAEPHRGPNEQPPEAHGIGAPTSSREQLQLGIDAKAAPTCGVERAWRRRAIDDPRGRRGVRSHTRGSAAAPRRGGVCGAHGEGHPRCRASTRLEGKASLVTYAHTLYVGPETSWRPHWRTTPTRTLPAPHRRCAHRTSPERGRVTHRRRAARRRLAGRAPDRTGGCESRLRRDEPPSEDGAARPHRTPSRRLSTHARDARRLRKEARHRHPPARPRPRVVTETKRASVDPIEMESLS